MPIKAPVLALFAFGAPFLLAGSPALAAGDKSPSKTDDTATDDSKSDDTKKGTSSRRTSRSRPRPRIPTTPSRIPTRPTASSACASATPSSRKFIINWFANGGRNVNAPMVGPEFITRRRPPRDRHLADVRGLLDVPLPLPGEERPDDHLRDLVQSQLKLAYAMVDILDEIPLEKKWRTASKTGRVALLLGGGVGMGGVFGNLYRSAGVPQRGQRGEQHRQPHAVERLHQRDRRATAAAAAAYCNNRNNHSGRARRERPTRRRLQPAELGQRRREAARLPVDRAPADQPPLQADQAVPDQGATGASRRRASSSGSRRATGCDSRAERPRAATSLCARRAARKGRRRRGVGGARPHHRAHRGAQGPRRGRARARGAGPGARGGGALRRRGAGRAARAPLRQAAPRSGGGPRTWCASWSRGGASPISIADHAAPAVTVAALAGAADQLTRLHRALLLHGDLKPANIIVGDDGRATLVDLGPRRHLARGRRQAGGPHPALRRAGAVRGQAAHPARRGVRAGRDASTRCCTPEVPRLDPAVHAALARGGRARHRRRSRAIATPAPTSSPARCAAPPTCRSRRRPRSRLVWPIVGLDGPATALSAQIAALRAGGGIVDHRAAAARAGARCCAASRGPSGVERPVAWIESASVGDVAEALAIELGALDARSARPRGVRGARRRRRSARRRRLARLDHARQAGSEAGAGARRGRRRSALPGPTFEVFAMPALSAEQAGELVRRTIPSLPDAVVAHVVARAEGWPGRVRAIVTRLARAPVVAPADVDRLLEEETSPRHRPRRHRAPARPRPLRGGRRAAGRASRATPRRRSRWPAPASHQPRRRAARHRRARPRARPHPRRRAASWPRASTWPGRAPTCARATTPRPSAAPRPPSPRLGVDRARAWREPPCWPGAGASQARSRRCRCGATLAEIVAVRGLAQSLAARHAEARATLERGGAPRPRRGRAAHPLGRAGRRWRSRSSATTSSPRPRPPTKRGSPPPRRRATPDPWPPRGSTSRPSPRRRAISPPPSATSRRPSTWAADRAASPRSARRCSTSPTSSSTWAAWPARGSRSTPSPPSAPSLPPQQRGAAPRARGRVRAPLRRPSPPPSSSAWPPPTAYQAMGRIRRRGRGAPGARALPGVARRPRPPTPPRSPARLARAVQPARRRHRAPRAAPLRPRPARGARAATRPARREAFDEAPRAARASGQKDWVWRTLRGAGAARGRRRPDGQGAPRPRGRPRRARRDRRAPPPRSARGVLERRRAATTVRAASLRELVSAATAHGAPRRRGSPRPRPGDQPRHRRRARPRPPAREGDRPRHRAPPRRARLRHPAAAATPRCRPGRASEPAADRPAAASADGSLHPRLARSVRRRPARALLAVHRRAGDLHRRAGGDDQRARRRAPGRLPVGPPAHAPVGGLRPHPGARRRRHRRALPGDAPPPGGELRRRAGHADGARRSGRHRHRDRAPRRRERPPRRRARRWPTPSCRRPAPSWRSCSATAPPSSRRRGAICARRAP